MGRYNALQRLTASLNAISACCEGCQVLAMPPGDPTYSRIIAESPSSRAVFRGGRLGPTTPSGRNPKVFSFISLRKLRKNRVWVCSEQVRKYTMTCGFVCSSQCPFWACVGTAKNCENCEKMRIGKTKRTAKS